MTSLSRAFGIRKALIQTVAFWEYWKQTPEDPIADVLVAGWWNYREAFEVWQENHIGLPPQPPIGASDDSSTGFAQIFAATAISSHNWSLEQGLVSGTAISADDWRQVRDVWTALRDDEVYNLSAVPKVLLWGASLLGIVGPRLNYSDNEVRRIIARYNGTGDDAEAYGYEVKGGYDIFESYNASIRN